MIARTIRNFTEVIGLMLMGLTLMGLAAVGMADEVRAADLGGPKAGLAAAEAPAKASPWTGLHLDLGAGWAGTSSDFTAVGQGDRAITQDDILVTLGVGYDWQLGSSWVAGFQADVTSSHLGTAWGNRNALDADWQGYVGARLGYIVAPKTLIYGTVGYTWFDGGLSFESKWDKTSLGDLTGVTYGGGVETLVTDGWSLKLDYRYVQLGDDTAPAGKFDGLKDGSAVDSGSHEIRLVLSKRL